MSGADKVNELFELAIKYVQGNCATEQYGDSGKELTTQDKLDFYGFFKIATVGDNDQPQPWKLQVVEYAKWNAWNQLNGMDAQEAKQKYIAKLTELAPEWESYARQKFTA